MTADEGERLLELRIEARADRLKTVRSAVRECVGGCGVGPDCTGDVVMAVDEACQNIIRHAYRGEPGGTIELTIDRRGAELVFSLRDEAPPIDPARVKPRDLADVRPGGLGTHLISEVMDEARFVPVSSDRGNLFRMVKRIR